jgi:hypothetical protein
LTAPPNELSEAFSYAISLRETDWNPSLRLAGQKAKVLIMLDLPTMEIPS